MGLSQQIGSSSLSKPGVCTSSTRPATPYEGQMIYETDTDKVLVWNGSAWYANWNLPFGLIAYSSTSTSTSLITTINTQITMSSFTAIANRYYKITYQEPSLFGVGASGEATASIFNGATLLRENIVSTTTAFSNPVTAIHIGTFTAGTVSIICKLTNYNSTTLTASRNSTRYAFASVEDMGVL